MGEPHPIGPDGSFDAVGAVVVRQGPAATRLSSGDALPFSDRRFA